MESGTLKVIIGCLVVIILFLGYKGINKEVMLNDQESINTALKDSLSTYKNKNGELVSRIKTINVSNVSNFIDVASKDSTINKLQDLVENYKKRLKDQGSAGVLNTQGKVSVITDTEISFKKDSLTTQEKIKAYPTYTSSFNLEDWVWGSVIADKDTTLIDLSFREEVSFVIGKEGTGFLGLKDEYFSDVKLKNPYNEVTQFRTYNTKIPKSKWALTLGGAGVYDFSTGDIQVFPAISFGYILFSK